MPPPTCRRVCRIDTSTGLITGTIAFTAAAGSPYAVSITVSDSPPTADATDTFTWTVTNVNREPTFDQDVLNRTDPEGTLVNLDAGATDPDGDTLTYAATNLPPGLSISTTTGLITGTIAFTASATPYNVSVTVRDGATVDATDTFQWTVTNVNREPTFDQDVLDQSHAEGAVISLDAGATDLDGDTLTYAATNLPPGLVDQHDDRADHRHHLVHRRRGQPVRRVGHRARRRHGRRHRHLRLGGHRCRRRPSGRSSDPRPMPRTTPPTRRWSWRVRRRPRRATCSWRRSRSAARRRSRHPPAGRSSATTSTATTCGTHTWWRFATASDPASWTWTFSAGRLAAGAIHAYGGVASTTPDRRIQWQRQPELDQPHRDRRHDNGRQ